MITYRREIGQRIRKLRTSKGWSQEHLAARWGRSRLSVVRLEQGQGDQDLDVLAKLADTFGISLVDLLAPVLGDELAKFGELQADAIQTLQRELAEDQRLRLEKWHQNVEREDVQILLQGVMNTAPLMPVDQVMFLCELLYAWRVKLGLPRWWQANVPAFVEGRRMTDAEEVHWLQRIRRMAEDGHPGARELLARGERLASGEAG